MRSIPLSRRGFLASSAALLPLAGCSSGPKVVEVEVPKAPVPDVLGVNLNSVRTHLDTAAKQTLQSIASMGYKAVEMTRADLPALLPLCKELGLAVPSAHFEYAVITNDWANYGGSPPRKGYNLQAALTEAKKAGLEYLVIPTISPRERGGMGMYLRLAQNLNNAGQQAKKMGLKLAYHNHSFEFRKFGQHTGFDILMNNIEKDLVHIQFDPFWVVIGNQDPVPLMRKHAHYMRLVHLKDMRQYTNPTFEDTVPVEAFRALGTGILDLALLMHSAHNAGVAHYFVHLDHFTGEPLDGLRQSYDYLQKMKAAPELPT